ncbi:MAG: amidase [Deltaproteobacteria bacterium]|nr:amidase [Deltaproteobacteria bacterium]MBW2383009.1 amidase [Deltaproteobacteria bacterium]MBW2695464.1 amidase [Deltaproteobacteria bacterium]
MADELATLDAIAQAELVRRGELSSVELVEAAIDRCERLNPVLNAVIHPALERARELATSKHLAATPFRGVPFLMKDIGGEEAGQPVHAGLGLAKRLGYRAKENSWFTQKLVDAGLVSLGRTNTPELALLPTSEPEAYGPTRNPWNTEHSSGGSSGGASAAVAAGIVPAAHASDGGGSIRGPASMCSLVGLKPTRGRCSFGPGLGERWSGFSSEFVVSRTLRDSAALLDVVAGRMPGDPYAAPPPEASFASALAERPRKLRVGVMTRAPRDIPLHPDLADATLRCAERLEELGHHVEAAQPEALDDPTLVIQYVTVVAANVARALDAWGEKLGQTIAQGDVEPLTWELACRGRDQSAPQLLAAIENVHRLGRGLASWWQGGFDLLLTPTQAAPPVRIGTLGSTREEPLAGFLRSAPYGVFTLPFNLSGQPAISLPGGFTQAGDAEWPTGLPLGVQLVAPYGEERMLLTTGAQLEEAAPWADQRPPHFG